MSLAEITSLLNHDLNCLSVDGADRFKRRQALKQLQAKIVNLGITGDSSKTSKGLRDSVILDLLIKPLLLSLQDPTESCRLGALEILTETIPQDPANVVKLLEHILPVILERFEHSSEKSEEIRLSLIQYLTNVLLRLPAPADLIRHHDIFIKIASKGLADQFPDVKLQTCSMITTFASLSADSCDFSALAPMLLANLKHQRQKVRSESLRALSALLYAPAQRGSKLPKWFIEEALPAFMNLTSDRSNHVREILFSEVFTILSSVNIPKGPVLNSLLLVILSGLSDDNEAVRQKVEYSVSTIKLSRDPTDEPKDYQNMLCDNLSDLLRTHVLPMICGWTSTIRLNALKMLKTLIGITKSGITSYVDRIIPCLVGAINDDDHDMAETLFQCAFSLGEQADLDATLQVIFSGLAESASHLNEDKSRKYLSVLCAFLRGAAAQSTSLTSDYIASILSLNSIYSLSDPRLMSQCIQFLDICIECAPLACKTFEFQFFYSLLQIAAVHPEFEQLDGILEKFRSLLGLKSISALFVRHFSSVLDRFQNSDFLPNNSPLLLCLVKHAAPSMSDDNTHRTVALLVKAFSYLDERSDRSEYDHLMDELTSLLTAIFDMFRFTPRIELFIDLLITNVFSKCLTWHVGRSATGLRLKAIQCLLIGAQRESLLETCSSSVLDQVFPQIVSCLDDYSLAIRLESLSLVQALIQKVGIPISIPDSFCGELLSRLDDSSDHVRIQVCSVLIDFYARKDINARSSLSDISSVALIHLDDPNPDVQAAVFSLLSYLRDSDASGQFQEAVKNVDVKLMTSPYVNKLFNST